MVVEVVDEVRDSLVEGEGIVARGVSFVDSALPKECRQLLWVDEVRLSCSTNLADLIAGAPQISAVRLRRPVLHAVANRLHDLVVAREWIHYVDPHVIDTLANEAGLIPLHASHHRRWWYAHDLLVFERRAPAHETT